MNDIDKARLALSNAQQELEKYQQEYHSELDAYCAHEIFYQLQQAVAEALEKVNALDNSPKK